MKWWWFSFWTMSVCWSVARCNTLIPSPQHHKHSVFRRVRTTRRTNYFYSGVTWLLACQWCEHVSMLMVAAPCLHPHCLLQAVCWIALTDKIVLKNWLCVKRWNNIPIRELLKRCLNTDLWLWVIQALRVMWQLWCADYEKISFLAWDYGHQRKRHNYMIHLKANVSHKSQRVHEFWKLILLHLDWHLCVRA